MRTRPISSYGERHVVNATHAVRNFGSIVARVREAGAVYVVERNGTPVAQVGPVDRRPVTMREFADLVGSTACRPEAEEYLRAVEEGITRLNQVTVPESPWER